MAARQCRLTYYTRVLAVNNRGIPRYASTVRPHERETSGMLYSRGWIVCTRVPAKHRPAYKTKKRVPVPKVHKISENSHIVLTEFFCSSESTVKNVSSGAVKKKPVQCRGRVKGSGVQLPSTSPHPHTQLIQMEAQTVELCRKLVIKTCAAVGKARTVRDKMKIKMREADLALESAVADYNDAVAGLSEAEADAEHVASTLEQRP
eukprot:1064436-Rhodomonas_salina.1